MDDKIKSFVFYRSWFEGLQDYSAKDRVKIYDAICQLALNEVEVPLTGNAATVMKFIKEQITQNTSKYKGGAKGKEYGKKGGRPKKENFKESKVDNIENPIGVNKKTPLNNVNVNDNVYVNVNDNDNVLGVFEDEFKRPLSSIECQTIADWQSEYSDDLLKLALSEAVKNNARSLSYIDTILRNWKCAGIKTAIEAQEQIEKHKKQKIRNSKERKLPDWYKNDNETYEQASEEEIAEFQKMLEEVNHV